MHRALAALVFVSAALLWLACGGAELDVVPLDDAGADVASGEDGGSPSLDGAGGPQDGSLPDGSSPRDGGSDASDAAFPTAPVTPIQFMSSCPAFAPCGGDPAGRWFYTSACIDDVEGRVRAFCSDAGIENLQGTVQGGATFTDGGRLERDVTVKFSGRVKVPQHCRPSFGNCRLIELGLVQLFDEATCVDGPSGSCNCDVASEDRIQQSAQYGRDGGVLTLDGGASYTYCVTGGDLKMRARGETQQREPGTFGLTKQ